MGKELVNKIRGMNPLTARGVLLVWAILLSFACLTAPRSADAAVTALTGNAWRTTSGTAITATTYFRGTTTAPAATNAYTIAAGPNRLLVVVLSINASAAQNTRIPTVKYGAAGTENKTLTLATSDQATSSRQHTWIFYLKEADIATANGTNLSFTYTGTVPTYTGTYANAAVYQNVDQTTPVLTPTTYNSGATADTTVGPLATSQVVATGDLTVEMVNALRTASTTAATLTTDTTPAAWTSAQTTTRTGTTPANYAARFAVLTQATAGTHDSTHSTGTTSVLDSMSAVTLKAGAVDITPPTVTAFTAPTSSGTVVISPITFTASDNSGTVAGYLINESATPPAAAAITSPTAPTSYTVASGGTKTLYAWVKDLSGNVSAAYPAQTVVVTVPSAPPRAVNWTQTYANATYPAGAAGSFTVPAGSNRLLVVAIASTSTAVGAQTVTNVTWGGKPLTLASGNGAVTTLWNHTYLYYLKEADIASASGTALTATITGGTSYYTYVYAAVYTGVDQTNPVPSAQSYTSTTLNTAVGPFSPTLTVDPFHQAVEVVNLARSASGTTGRTITTWATGWTTAGVAPTGIVTTGPTLQLYIRDRAVPAVLTNDGSQHVASSTNSFKAMTAMSLKYAASGVNLTTGATVPNRSVYAGDQSVAVDAFTLQTTVADTVTSIQVTGSAASTSTNVARLKIYRKVGSNPAAYETGDVELANVSNPFAGGTVANVPVSEVFTGTDARNYIIVYDIAAGASPSLTNKLIANVTAFTVTNPGTLSDTTAGGSGEITIYPTTTIGNGNDLALPAARLFKSSALTKLDEFILSHNSAQSTDNDTISTVTVTLTPTGISGGGPVLSKISRLEVVSADGNTVYGFMTAPTTGDIWNVPTPTLVATSTPTTYYIRVATPANIVDGFYTVGGTITAVVHSKGTSKLDNADLNSQTLSIDIEGPNGPSSLVATTTAPAIQPGGKIDLSWNTASDPNGGQLHATTPYIIKRSVAGGVDPAEYCSDGTTVPITLGSFTFTDSGLNDTSAPIYHYRICAMDTLGNISVGTTASVASSYTNYCNIAPDVTLGSDDPLNPGTIQDQLVKSEGGNPFLLQITNNDIGTCPNVVFDIAIVDAYTTGGSGIPAPSVADFSTTFPATVTLGKAISKTSTTESIYINGLATADQIQKYIFKVRVSEAQHPTITTAFATAVLNDMPPIVHNANNMAKYQYGTWGNDYTCATCHSNSTTNIKGVYQIISTPIGKRNVVFKRTSGSILDTDSYSNDQRLIKNVSNNVCSVCHHRTRQHQYSANKATGGPANDVPYASDHHNNHDCVRCHTHNTAFRSILGVCGDCHGFKGTQYSPVNKATMVKNPPTNALGTSPPSYGAHLRHNIAQMSCAVCHNNTNHGLATDVWLGDELLEIGFRIDNTTFPGFNPAAPMTGGVFEGTTSLNAPYSWAAGPGTTINVVNDSNASCNTYCHGTWSGNQGSNIKPNWVGTGQAGCGTCHYATTVTPPTSGSHKMHAGTGTVRAGVTGLGIECSKCHSTYASYTGSAHINGNVEWNLSQIDPTALYNGSNASSTGAAAPTNSAAYSTCTNMYCHSNVQGEGGVGAPTYAAPKWGDNNIISDFQSTTAYCGSCHIYPNNVGGHEQHESLEFSFACQTCHNNGGRTTPLSHANGKINFEFVGLGVNTRYKGISTAGSINPQTGYGTCSNSDCHGRYIRTWGPPSQLALCDKCHGSRTSDLGFYNTRGPDGTLSIYSAAIGVHDIHLQNPNSPRKSTFSRFTSFAVGMNCNQCHYNPTGPFSSGHMDTALPAEVPFAHMSTIAHIGDAFGYYSTPKFDTATQSCSSVWCHGAGMQSNTARGLYAGKTPVSPLKPKWNEPMLAANPCTKCHAMPPAASSSADTHWNVGADRAYILSECVGCHQHLNTGATGFVNKALHVNGVIDGGCTGCHGDPPTTTGIGTETGLATPDQHALQLGTAGAHQSHINNVNILKNCYTCHYSYNPVMTSDGTGKLEIGFNGFGGTVINGTFNGYTNSVNGPVWQENSAPGGSTIINKVNASENPNQCSNVYCHGSTITGGMNKTPNWEGVGTDAVCGTCHGGDPTSVPFPAQSGAHTRHASNSVGGLQIACGTCHGASAQSLAHVDGKVVWQLDANNPKIGTSARYRGYSTGTTGALAPSATYGQCTNFYCHSNVQGAGGIGDPTTYQPMTWGASPVITCSSCHADQTSAGTASHVKHTTLYGGATACGYCHHNAGDGTELHADRMIYVNITTSKLGAGVYTGSNRDAGSPAGYGSCTNIICHGAATLQWGANLGTVQCHKCHGSKSTAFATTTSAQVAPGYGADGIATDGATSASSRRVGAHQRHLITDVLSSNVKCSECHVKVTNVLDNGHLNYTTATLTFSGRATGNGHTTATTSRNASFTIQCSNLWCHTAKSNSGSTPVPVWTTTGMINETTLSVASCTVCHGFPPKNVGAGGTTLSYNHSGITDPTNFPVVSCSCHSNLSSTGTTYANVFTDKTKHLNGTIEALSGHNKKYPGATHAVVAEALDPATNCAGCHTNWNLVGPYPATPAGTAPSCRGCHTTGILRTVATSSCYDCHGATANNGMPNGNVFPNISGSHSAHIAMSYVCTDCHVGGGAGAATHGSYSGVAKARADVKVAFNTAKAGTAAAWTYGTLTCGTSVCHGQKSPVWGTRPSTTLCTTCHGQASAAYASNYSSALIAPGGSGRDTGGNTAATSPRVGSHQQHLTGAMKLSKPVHCGECHTVHVALNEGTHLNYTTATINFGPLAKVAGHTPSATRSGGVITCSTVYCHEGQRPAGTGANQRGTITTTWAFNGTSILDNTTINGTCADKCHGMPPGRTVSGDTHFGVAAPTTVSALSTCSSLNNGSQGTGCHPTIKSRAAGITNFINLTSVFASQGTLHINGSVEGGTCTGCHAKTTGTARMAITGQFTSSKNSHHYQGAAAVDGKVCYACHWEANSDGSINSAYHHSGTSNAVVELVVWGTNTTRPTTYAGNSVTYQSGGATASTRAEIGKINTHCLGCHNDTNKSTATFTGDAGTPSKYSWEGLSTAAGGFGAAQSIGAKYLSTTTTNWGKFAVANNVNNKQPQVKAFSAHGNADVNQRGWSTLVEPWNSTVANYPNTSGSVEVVLCYDCHNSHGSNASAPANAVTSSYSSATGRNKGAILKTTEAGKGGYTVSYRSYTGGNPTTKNPYKTGAGICFDCHNNANVGNATSVGSATPWGYSATFNATQMIHGYNDNPYFGKAGGTFAKGVTYPYLAAGGLTVNRGGHLFASSAMTTTPNFKIKGLCTPCHDPHGVSPGITAGDQQYAVPLLKGTFITSPYKQDAAPANTNEARGGGSEVPVQSVGSTPGYHIDQNTMQAASTGKPATARYWAFGTSATTLQTYADTQFAGLCIKCHNKADINETAAATSTNWKSMKRIHNSVDGWASTGGANAGNVVHAYTCSKCHSSHNSNLPRLLVTNCLDAKHRGRVTTGGQTTKLQTITSGSRGAGLGRFAGGGAYGHTRNASTATNPGPWFFGVRTTTVQVTTANLITTTQCHERGTANNGWTTNGSGELWNTKSTW